MPRWDKFMNVLGGIMSKNNNTEVEKRATFSNVNTSLVFMT
jgi:hypothetical protein